MIKANKSSTCSLSETGTSTKFQDRTQFPWQSPLSLVQTISKSATYPEPWPTKESVYLMHTGLISPAGQARRKQLLIFSVLLYIEESTWESGQL